MTHELTHRDEIHGDVVYDPLAVALLNTSAIQRLGRVYQLGYGHLVYRGGTHTRLSHSMGAFHTAARLVSGLRDNYERQSPRPSGVAEPAEFLPHGVSASAPPADEGELTLLPSGEADVQASQEHLDYRWQVLRHLVGWAAILHDVGHVPLGHTLEDEFEGIYPKHDHWGSDRLQFLWFSGQGGEPEIRQVLRRTELYPEAFRMVGITNWEDVWGALLLICLFKERVDQGQRTTFPELLSARDQELGEPSKGTKADRRAVEQERAVIARIGAIYERLSRTVFHPYMADIVANTISADYLDYLRRDAQNLGLDVLKDDRIASRYWVGTDYRGQLRMTLSLVDRRGKPRLDTCTGVIELVRQRYRFAEIVYYHKTKVSASAMLAKVFHLAGKPPDTPTARSLPALHEVDRAAKRLLGSKDKTASLKELRTACLPSSLLDPEIGDEALIPLLMDRAWHQVEEGTRSGKLEPVTAGLHALSLLGGIARRQLYKVAVTVDAEAFRHLNGQSHSPPGDVEHALRDFIQGLRESADERERLEGLMSDAAGWPTVAFLVYVPPRKAQAKGIDTGALLDGRVVTLGTHNVVKQQVEDLNARYTALWRLIILVHPDHAEDAIPLSAAVDAFVGGVFPRSVDEMDGVGVDALRSSCWFPYLPRQDRPAAEYAARLVSDPLDWSLISRCAALGVGHVGDEELALRAALWPRLEARRDEEFARRTLEQRFGSPGSLRDRVEELVVGAAVDSSEGGDDSADAVTRAVLDRLADDVASS